MREAEYTEPVNSALAGEGEEEGRGDAETRRHGEAEHPKPALARRVQNRKAESVLFEPANFQKILLLLRDYSGVDFFAYKSGTFQRRTLRRMGLKDFKTLADYAGFLEGNAEELDCLCSDVLIQVTSFFRNPESYAALQRICCAKLVQRPRDQPIRIWVPGCSTGQEAYSLAMLLAELFDGAGGVSRLQIFATDLNEKTLVKARSGFYTRNLLRDVLPERLDRFFTREEGGFRIRKSLRETCVFARQDLLRDPPFSRLDLVSCRNLLIYIQPAWQMKVLPVFHYALKPGALLFLGASESVGPGTDLFEAIDQKHPIYARKPGPIRLNAECGVRSLE